jgi:hypothetical protein
MLSEIGHNFKLRQPEPRSPFAIAAMLSGRRRLAGLLKDPYWLSSLGLLQGAEAYRPERKHKWLAGRDASNRARSNR